MIRTMNMHLLGKFDFMLTHKITITSENANYKSIPYSHLIYWNKHYAGAQIQIITAYSTSQSVK